ncbi:MAG: hypothetical protein IJX37_07120 [Oscillospiraceae bacterium]|nr:hypothetical protein [Oscillospiraceae bacterium]
MVLVLVLMLCMCPYAAAQDTASEANSYAGFHAPTVRKIIEVNLECENADEEFFHLLTNAYLADPELLIETILDLPQEDIEYLARAIAYDLQKTQRQTQATVQTGLTNPAADAVGKLIALETADTSNASLDAFLDEDMLAGAVTGGIPDADSQSAEELTAALSLSASEAEVASPLTASISLSTTLPALTSRRYTIKFYKQQGNESWQCGTMSAILGPNSTLTTASRNLTFNATGVYQVYAEVYDSSNVLVATSPSVTVTVSGQWHIDVVLPTDRNYKGTLILYNASGMVLLSTECLGQSASNADPSIYLGNTPTGECQGALVGPVGENQHGSYGPYKFISLTPISGNMKDYTWRSEFLIHGGSPETNSSLPRYPLRPTNGCIRVSNYDQLQLQNLITNLVANEYHYSTGTVSITEQA